MSKKNKIILLLISSILIIGLVIVFLFKDEKTYTLKKYNPKTKVTSVSEYVIRHGDTVFHGNFVRYNQKGNKIAEGNFVDDEPRGKSIYYFDNGNIETIQIKSNSKITIEAIWNYSNGNIERYISYDDLGNTLFIVFFDEQGNVKKHVGYALVEIYQYKIANKEQFKIKTKQNLKVGDVLKYKYLLANVPNAKRSFNIELLDSNNAKIKRTITMRPPTVVDVEEVLTKKGLNKFKAVAVYKFNDSKHTVIKDSVYFNVEVK